MSRRLGHLIVNATQIAAKVIDGEAMIMNVRSGIYYSIEGVGASIWSCIEAGECQEQIVGAVVSRYEVTEARARSDLAKLIAKLLDEQIVLGVEDPDAPGRATATQTGQPRQTYREPYREPELVIYRDMGDLLALDPLGPNAADLDWDDSA